MLLALRSLWESAGGDLSVDLIGVAASPAVGNAFRIDVDFAISGVAASPAIGGSRIDVTDPITGVFGSAAIGVGAFDADFAISGVAASPAIGEGTVTGATDTAPPVVIASQGGAGFGRPELAWFKRQQARKKRPFDVDGVAANPQVGQIQVDIEIPVSGVAAAPQIGRVVPFAVVDLTEEEMIVLLLAA